MTKFHQSNATVNISMNKFFIKTTYAENMLTKILKEFELKVSKVHQENHQIRNSAKRKDHKYANII